MCCDEMMLVFIVCISIVGVVVLAVGAWVCSFTWNRAPKGPDQVAALVTQAKELPISQMPLPPMRPQRSVAGIPFAPSPTDMMIPPPPPTGGFPDDAKLTPGAKSNAGRPAHISQPMPPMFTPPTSAGMYQPTPPHLGPPGGRLPPLRGSGARRHSAASIVSDAQPNPTPQRRGSSASSTFQQQADALDGVAQLVAGSHAAPRGGFTGGRPPAELL